MNIGLTSILRERRRQIEVEGWTAEHDDKHDYRELFTAAGCYHWAADLERCILSNETPEEIIPAPLHWPWDKSWWKPASTPRRNYEKAGALYLAEQERLERRGEAHAKIKECAEHVEMCAAHINGILSPFIRTFNRQQEEAYENSRSKGFHDTDTHDGVRLMLIVSEAAEALEFIRHGNPKSDHIPEFSGVEEELADIVIRVMDFAEKRGHRVAEAVESKMQFNSTRPHMHGGKAL